jgi:hypothetical protein
MLNILCAILLLALLYSNRYYWQALIKDYGNFLLPILFFFLFIGGGFAIATWALHKYILPDTP